MSKSVDIDSAEANFENLLSLLKDNPEIILTKKGIPIGIMKPISSLPPRVAGLHPGAIQTSEDFDQPLPGDLGMGEP